MIGISCLNKRYVVELYNKRVLELLKENQQHPIFEDRWANVQGFMVEADTVSGAVEQANMLYPKDDGFVITRVSAVEA